MSSKRTLASFGRKSGRLFVRDIIAAVPTVEQIAADYDLWKAYAGEELAGEMANYTQAEREEMILTMRSEESGLPAGPDPDAPTMHRAWEEALDAEQAAQRLQAALQPYAAGLCEPEDITPEDRQRIGLFLVSVRASLRQVERLIQPPAIVLPVITNKSS